MPAIEFSLIGGTGLAADGVALAVAGAEAEGAADGSVFVGSGSFFVQPKTKRAQTEHTAHDARAAFICSALDPKALPPSTFAKLAVVTRK